MNKKYLPSKKFIYIFGSFVVVILILLLVFILFLGKNSVFSSKKSGELGINRMNSSGLDINELVQKDSDSDGVADWEEALWGTDKNNPTSFNGMADKTYIENKRKQLNSNGKQKNEEDLTETEKFAREFFTAYVAMKASGEVDPETINSFASTLGEKIASPDIPDKYTIKDLKISTDDSAETKKLYYENVVKAYEKYKIAGIGEELDVISTQLTSPAGEENPDKLTPIAKAYQDFASEILKIQVPGTLAEDHLKMVNLVNNTGVSIVSMSKMTADPIIGLSGISKYQEYSDALTSTIDSIKSKL